MILRRLRQIKGVQIVAVILSASILMSSPVMTNSVEASSAMNQLINVEDNSVEVTEDEEAGLNSEISEEKDDDPQDIDNEAPEISEENDMDDLLDKDESISETAEENSTTDIVDGNVSDIESPEEISPEEAANEDKTISDMSSEDVNPKKPNESSKKDEESVALDDSMPNKVDKKESRIPQNSKKGTEDPNCHDNVLDNHSEENNSERIIIIPSSTPTTISTPSNYGTMLHTEEADTEAGSKVTSVKTSANRMLMVKYSMNFLGNPYVWGGESLTDGCDCSGFTMMIYRQFGIELPRCSYEQAEVGTKIAAKDALPGDLLFYARDGAVYHVLMYIGNGQAINASSSTTGIIISNVDYNKTCWGVRLIDETEVSTQTSTLLNTGKKAYLGDDASRRDIIEAIYNASQEEHKEYGFLPSVLIAQVIQKSEWLSFNDAVHGGIQPEDNNLLSIDEEMSDSKWNSFWSGGTVIRTVSSRNSKKEESIRTYESIEACLCDYAAYQIEIHPELTSETDANKVISLIMDGTTEGPSCQETIRKLIEEYDLTKYDVSHEGGYATDSTNYTQDEMELIWAIVAQEDDTSYEGALAVISSAMNRADKNYGGYGTSVLEQLTADGQYCYSPKVSDPSLYQRRLDGNVDDYVKQAVSDCLKGGVRNNDYLNFRSSNRTGQYEQIGGNWYF